MPLQPDVLACFQVTVSLWNYGFLLKAFINKNCSVINMYSYTFSILLHFQIIVFVQFSIGTFIQMLTLKKQSLIENMVMS